MRMQESWLALAGLGALLAAAAVADAASLDVYVTHLRPTQTVRVSVYADAASWARGRGPVASRVFAARAIAQTLRIDGLAPGRYAVRVEQGPNRGPVEVPSFAFERNGTSGNGGRCGLPPFERAAVNVGTDGARVPVHMFVSDRM